MMGVSENERLPPSAYTPQMHARVYGEIVSRAGRLVADGHAVIADAVFGREDERAAIEHIAREQSVRFEGVWLEADASVLMARIESRREDASDATVDVLKRQLSEIEPPAGWSIVSASGAIEDVAENVRLVLNAVKEPKTIS
jgi:predicted kinase